MEKEELKARVFEAVDEAREEILALSRSIYAHPETGYREVCTSAGIVQRFRALGLEVRQGVAYTGCRAALPKRKEGPTAAVFGEMDSLICSAHPDSDPQTGAMHACGHHLQIAVMYGVAAAMMRCGALDLLDGNVVFMALPAEEYIELEYRSRLKREGIIRYFSGKAQAVYEGALDDVDLAMMTHIYPLAPGYACAAASTWNGFIGKQIRFIGRQAHAGAAPWEGINALNMANLAMTATNFQRETFRDADKVRIHGIITGGGEVVNSVPDEVTMELTVRAANIRALLDANAKVDRSIGGAAMAIGGGAAVEDMPGQMPLKASRELAQIYTENAGRFYPPEAILPELNTTASTDMGDISLIMPVLHSLSGGMTGGLHAKDYRIVDEEKACIVPVKILCGMLIDLLYDGAGRAKALLEAEKPEMTREEYLSLLDSMERTTCFGQTDL